VDTSRTSTEEFVKDLPTYKCTEVQQIITFCTGGVALKMKTINYVSEEGYVKPTKAYLELSFNISVTGTQHQPGTSVRTDYLQTTLETGKTTGLRTFPLGRACSMHSRTNGKNELTGTSKSNKKLVTATS
jgi:hypothetical protein